MENNQLAIITQQAGEVTKNVASIKTDITNAITDNNNSLQACITAGENLLSLASADDAMNDELDAQIASFIKKASATKKAMTERRKGVTQVFDLVKSGFTKMEAFLDSKSEESIVYKLQAIRDKYAAHKLELQRKAEEERQRQARISAQKAQVGADTAALCNDLLTLLINDKSNELQKLFSDVTLENKDAQLVLIKNFDSTIKLATFMRLPENQSNLNAYQVIVRNTLSRTYPDLTPEDIKQARNESFATTHADCEARFKESIDMQRQEIVDRFDSKIVELEEQKRLEEERKRKEEEARKAEEERKRKEAELKAARDEEERKRKEAELKAAEEERLKKEAEAKAAEEERLKKEAELKAAEEAAEKERLAKLEAEKKAREQEEAIKQAQNQSQTLFDQAPSAAAPVKVKTSHHIDIMAPEGFLPVIQMWWSHEGKDMSLDDLKKKLSFMVKTCEKLFNKEDVKIVDDNVVYVEDVKAK